MRVVIVVTDVLIVFWTATSLFMPKDWTILKIVSRSISVFILYLQIVANFSDNKKGKEVN